MLFNKLLHPLLSKSGQSDKPPIDEALALDLLEPLQPSFGPKVDIPLRDPSVEGEARNALIERGQFLARQDNWETLCRDICKADHTRMHTDGLMPKSLLLVEGALTDLLGAARRSVMGGDTAAPAEMIQAMSENFEDMPDCPAGSYLIAAAHHEVAKLMVELRPVEKVEKRRDTTYLEHLEIAQDLADRYDPFQWDSGMWAKMRCDLLWADAAPRDRVSDDYENLIDLDPFSAIYLQNFGRDLLPHRYGYYDYLDRQARKMTLNVEDIWGHGGYVWIYLGAFCHDENVLAHMDADLLSSGIHDILDRFPSQNMVNVLASFAGQIVQSRTAPDSVRAVLKSQFEWILHTHLRELHPFVWATMGASMHDTKMDFKRSDLILNGMNRAVTTIADHFADELRAGKRAVFGANGLEFC